MFKFIIKKVLVVVLIVSLVGFGLDRLLDVNDYRQCDLNNTSLKTCHAADAVIVISGGDTSARTRHAIKIVKKELASVLIVSGASQQSGVPSNAEEMRDIAFSEGLSESQVLMDKQARNTNQNASYVRELINEYNAKNQYNQIKSVILVTSAYHQNRAYKEFRASLDPEMPIYNAPLLKDRDWSDRWFLSAKAWKLALTEAVGILLAPRG
ncbi:MAG: YdcF family protein [Candidatus Saccharibacteria bacterium]|nr:YdcF family protein [Candidatus Saccharibacteria bacterium]